MNEGWMRVREAAAVLSISESTVRRRLSEGGLHGRTGRSGRQEVLVKAPAASEGLPPADLGAKSASRTAAVRSAVESDASLDELIGRYERLAGGSLMLAQQRADELTQAASAAYENLAHARSQIRLLRKVALTGWAVGAVAIVFGFVLSLAFAMRSADLQARAQAGERVVDDTSKHFEGLKNQASEVRGQASPVVSRQALVDSD